MQFVVSQFQLKHDSAAVRERVLRPLSGLHSPECLIKYESSPSLGLLIFARQEEFVYLCIISDKIETPVNRHI